MSKFARPTANTAQNTTTKLNNDDWEFVEEDTEYVDDDVFTDITDEEQTIKEPVTETLVTGKSETESSKSNFFKGIFTAIKEDLKGSSTEQTLTDTDNLDDKPAPAKKKSKSKNGWSKKLLNLYKIINDFLFKVLLGILGLLTKIPIVGKVIKPLLKATKVLRIISNFLPLLLIPLILFIGCKLSVPNSITEIELPDEGHITVGQTKVANDHVELKILNDGNVVAKDVLLKAKIYSYQPRLNPITWFKWQYNADCEGKELPPVNIDESKTINLQCSYFGIFPKAVVALDGE